jgi:prepilin-type N-terminal cleavage/methylation domain-containing protein
MQRHYCIGNHLLFKARLWGMLRICWGRFTVPNHGSMSLSIHSRRLARKMRRAFTLIEVMICILIISILASILFPVFSRSLASAHGVRSLSNLRQSFLSLAVYETDYAEWPDYEQAILALASAPTHDPDDYWKVSHGKPFEPMIYSYAYVRGVKYSFGSNELWREFLAEQSTNGKTVPLLASVWQSEQRTKFVSSSSVFPTQPAFFRCWAERRCFLPPRVTYVYLDGSAKGTRFHHADPPRPLYWDHLFLRPIEK